MRERHKIMITEEMYERVDTSSNYEAIKPLFENDNKDKDNILCKINHYEILEKAILIDDYSFVKEVLHYKKLNCKSYTYESNFMEANNLSNLDILKLLIDSSVEAMPTVDVNVDGKKKDSGSQKVHDPRYFNLLLNILIRMENILLINYLLKNNPSDVNLNSKDINGEYPIFNAYHRNRKDIFNYLLDYDFDCNIKNNNVSLLSLAISNNEYELIKYLLKHNANIKETDINGNYPLIKAIYQNAIDIVILLVEYANEHEIDMNVTDINGNTPLTLSYRLNYKTIFKYLVCYLDINMRDSNGNNILYYAIEDEDLETIRYLIHNKIDVHSINNLNISPFDCAIIKGKKILTLLLENSNNSDIAFNVPNSKNETPLITIIKSKNYSLKEKENIISMLIAKGANVNFIDEKDMTPLIYAIQEKSLSLVQMLVKNGANVNHCNPSDSCKTILKYAIDSNQYEIVKYLVQCNANINFDNPYSLSLFGNTFKEIDKIDVHILEYIIVKMDVKYITGVMLYKIIRQGNLKILKSLIERKLDVNMKDSEGDSLLAIAIFYKDESIVRYLIECEGVDFNSENKRGKSIADYNEEYFGKNNSYEDIYNRVQQRINDSSSTTTSSDNISSTATIF
jgi:ankyrin repeat protein